MRFFFVIACFAVVVLYSVCSTIIHSQDPNPSFNEESIPVNPNVVHVDRVRSMKIRTFDPLEQPEEPEICFHDVRFVLTTDKQVYRPKETWFLLSKLMITRHFRGVLLNAFNNSIISDSSFRPICSVIHPDGRHSFSRCKFQKGVYFGEYHASIEGIYSVEMQFAAYSLVQSTQVMVNRYKENRIHIEVDILLVY